MDMLKKHSGEYLRIMNLAKSHVHGQITQAQAQADANVQQAHTDARQMLKNKQKQAKWMNAPVLKYCFNVNQELSNWEPIEEKPPFSLAQASSTITDVIVNSSEKKIFWPEHDYGTINRCDADGSNIQVIYNVNMPHSLAADFEAGKLFWLENFNCIMEGDIEGSVAPKKVLDIDKYAGNVKYIKFDAIKNTEGKYTFYWADGYHVNCATSNQDKKQLSKTPEPTYMAVDRVRQKLYWMDDNKNLIFRANMDGSGEETVCPINTMYIKRGMSVDEITGNLFFLDKDENDEVWLKQYDLKVGKSISIIKVGEITPGFGLSLMLKATNEKLQQAMVHKEQNQLQAQSNISVAKKSANTQVKNANDKKQENLDTAHKKITDEQNKADTQRNQKYAELEKTKTTTQQKIKTQQDNNKTAISHAHQKAQTSITQAHNQAAAKKAAAQKELNKQREYKREKIH
ncbi:MAG: hypothetical protein ACC651_02140 [Candidatus Scalindua sp.]